MKHKNLLFWVALISIHLAKFEPFYLLYCQYYIEETFLVNKKSS